MASIPVVPSLESLIVCFGSPFVAGLIAVGIWMWRIERARTRLNPTNQLEQD